MTLTDQRRVSAPRHSSGGGRRVWPWATAAVLIVLLVGGLLALGITGRDSAPAPLPGMAAAPVAPVPLPAPAPDQSVPAAAGLDTDQTVPTTTPDVDWQPFYGVWLPTTSPTSDRYAGPTVTTGPVVSGYADTPLGALLAAEQIGVRYILTPHGGWAAVTRQQTVGQAGQASWLKQRATLPDTDSGGGGYAQSAGFRFLGYTPSMTSLQLVFRQSDGVLVVNSVTLVWSGGDWKLQLQPDGTTSPVLNQASSLTGYVPFGKV